MECDTTSLFAALNILVKPAETGSTGELHDILQLNIYKALEKLNISNIGALDTLGRVCCAVSEESSVRWKFVCVTLHILLSLKERLMKQTGQKTQKASDVPAGLLSVNQQKTIKTCLQFIISMGLLPSLLPGVGISLAARCNNVKKLKDEDLVVLEKYERLAAVTRGLLVCCEQPTLRTVILEEHLGDTMAALSQLSFVPLKKPAATKSPEVPAAAAAKDDFVMTKELWTKLQDDRSHFKSYYLTFVAQVYQPLVIKELLLLQGSGTKAGLKTKPPGWLKRACIQLLVQCLMRPGGVSSMIRAICELSPLDIAEEWVKLDTVVRLITTAHSLQEDVYYKCIGRQMIEMLSLKDTPSNQLLTRVAVLCIKSLSENKPKMCRRYILNVIMTPLLLCTYDPNEGSEDTKENTGTNQPETLQAPKPVASEPPATSPQEKMSPAEEEDPNTCLNLFTGPDSHMIVKIHSETLLSTEENVSKCILNLYKCFVAPDSSVNALSPDLLWLVAPILFRLHLKVYKSASYLRPFVQELLLRFMSSCMQDKLHSAFGAFLFGDRVDGMVVFSDHVDLVFGSKGGVQVMLKEETAQVENKDILENQSSEEAGHCLLELLEQGDKMGDMTNVLFVSLLHMLSDPKNESEASRNYMKVSNSELLDLEDVIVGMMGSSKNMVTIKFLIILAGNPSIQERIHEEPGPIIRFIQYLLEREAKVLVENKTDNKENIGAPQARSFSEDGEFDEDDNERLYTIVMILGILISSNSESVRCNWDAFKGLQKPLKLIADHLEDGETRELASRMYNTIITHGVINEPSPMDDHGVGKGTGSTDESRMQQTNGEPSKPGNFDDLVSEFGDLIQQVAEHDKMHAQVKKNKNARPTPVGRPSSGKFIAKEGSPCKVALQGVTETAIPIRGHALLELAKLINKGDQEAQRNRNHILRIFQENLKHEDSYIYLSCINGLAALANVFPNTVIQTLIEEFATLRSRKDTTIDPSDLMMKIGEVLVRVTKQLGDFVPTYKSMLLNAFLSSTRDPDPLVRASSLSNLGQVCQALGFRIGSVSGEILLCVRSIVQTDPSVVVRRAAILVITLLLQGLGEDALKLLGQVMLGLYRTLKVVHQQETDEVVKLHCQLALEELNKTTLAFLFPQRRFEKQIFVLNAPH